MEKHVYLTVYSEYLQCVDVRFLATDPDHVKFLQNCRKVRKKGSVPSFGVVL